MGNLVCQLLHRQAAGLFTQLGTFFTLLTEPSKPGAGRGETKVEVGNRPKTHWKCPQHELHTGRKRKLFSSVFLSSGQNWKQPQNVNNCEFVSPGKIHPSIFIPSS